MSIIITPSIMESKTPASVVIRVTVPISKSIAVGIIISIPVIGSPIWVKIPCIIRITVSVIEWAVIVVDINGDLVWICSPGCTARFIGKTFFSKHLTVILARRIGLYVGKDGSLLGNGCKLFCFFSKQVFIIECVFIRFLVIISSISLAGP